MVLRGELMWEKKCKSMLNLKKEEKKNTLGTKNNLGFNARPVVWLLNNGSHVEKRANKMNKSELKRQFGESNH